MLFLVPAVEAADHIDRFGVWRPHSEKYSLYTVFHREMRSEFLIDVVMSAL